MPTAAPAPHFLLLLVCVWCRPTSHQTLNWFSRAIAAHLVPFASPFVCCYAAAADARDVDAAVAAAGDLNRRHNGDTMAPLNGQHVVGDAHWVSA